MNLDRRLFARLATAAAVSLSIPGLAVAQTRNKVVMQVSDSDPVKWNLALNNARALQADLGVDGVDIEIVVYGPGIGMLKKESTVAPRIADAMKAGVKVEACENTMKSQSLVPADMQPEIGYVPSGVVEVMRKQQQGWSYIKP